MNCGSFGEAILVWRVHGAYLFYLQPGYFAKKTAQMLPPWKQDVLKSFQLEVVSDKEVYNIVAWFWAVYKHWTPRNQGLQYSLTILLGATFVSLFIFPLILTPHFRCCLTGWQVPTINNLMIYSHLLFQLVLWNSYFNHCLKIEQLETLGDSTSFLIFLNWKWIYKEYRFICSLSFCVCLCLINCFWFYLEVGLNF